MHKYECYVSTITSCISIYLCLCIYRMIFYHRVIVHIKARFYVPAIAAVCQQTFQTDLLVILRTLLPFRSTSRRASHCHT